MFTGIYGVCEGDAYVEAPVSALLLSIWRHCRFFYFIFTTLLLCFLFSAVCFLIPCNLLFLFFSLWGAMVIVWSI